MYFINVQTLELEEFFGETPQYAILLHTWESDEVKFKDFTTDLADARTKKEFRKI
ncbi:hypothetical protein B0T25DRAFT_541605 [Lasiosphaeria hispida]|uniref:Uncharacterized protein n=1 Tax=Lasiosphaeria hispida TaxID=260671 RepID=A0AAJ0MDN7_9PEZI|nr:hypothetical protein B0T25DRAFT_541605 [Lasiosphaeria hispida]